MQIVSKNLKSRNFEEKMIFACLDITEDYKLWTADINWNNDHMLWRNKAHASQSPVR